MAIKPKTSGIHHLTLRSTDYERSKDFYINKLGFDLILEIPNLFIFLAGQSAIAVRGPEARTPAGDRFNPFRAGMDHVALGCSDLDELNRVATELTENSIENTGVKKDETLGKMYVAFKDPDRISWEFYMV
ncbi:MAG: VOC family protein [Saprospiraceae bacterium]|nr:VOC family protein [Saprospiraceae bacterium]MCB9319307.1 VOC family protein [Lewinellaceae bacterium]